MQTFPISRIKQYTFGGTGMPMGLAPEASRPNVREGGFLGQDPPAWQGPQVFENMTKEQLIVEKNKLLKAAAAENLNKAADVKKNLDKVYSDYTRFGAWSWVRTVVSQVVLPAIGPMVDSWVRSSDAEKAHIIIQSSLSIAQKWMNATKENFLPVFFDKIEEMDPALSSEINKTFDDIVSKFKRNSELMTDTSKLPQVWLGRGEDVFFGQLAREIPKMIDRLADLANALAKLMEAIEKIIASFTKAATAAPYLVLTGVGIIAVWLLVR